MLVSAVQWRGSATCGIFISCLLSCHPPPRSSESTAMMALCDAAGSHQPSVVLGVGRTYVSPNLSVHPTPAPLFTHPFPTFVSLFLPWKFHLYHFSRFHIYAWIYDTCFSLSDWLYSLWQFLGPSTSLRMTQFHSFLWLSDIPLYICTTSSLSIHLSMDI